MINKSWINCQKIQIFLYWLICIVLATVAVNGAWQRCYQWSSSALRWQVAQLNACAVSTHGSKGAQLHGGNGADDKAGSIFGSIISSHQGLSETSHCGKHSHEVCKVCTIQDRWRSTWMPPGCSKDQKLGKSEDRFLLCNSFYQTGDQIRACFT